MFAIHKGAQCPQGGGGVIEFLLGYAAGVVNAAVVTLAVLAMKKVKK